VIEARADELVDVRLHRHLTVQQDTEVADDYCIVSDYGKKNLAVYNAF